VDERTLPPPPHGQPQAEVCYRHPDVPTGVHCTRCGRPICPDCMNAAPVGHHCPTCVAEARREFRRGPGRRIAIADAKATSVTTILLVVIGVMFILQSTVQFDLGVAQPLAIADGEWWRMLSSIFLHANLLHLLFNAWGLFIFGPIVERTFGRSRMLTIFLVSGFIGSVASYLVTPIAFPDLLVPSVGASGALFGLVGAVLVHSYRRRGSALGRANLQWAIMIIVLNLAIGLSVPRIDLTAHIGGAIGGAVCAAVAELLDRRKAVEWIGYAMVVLVGVVLTIVQTNRILEAVPRFLGSS
jgi:membrane associated rhomboid family serine protease